MNVNPLQALMAAHKEVQRLLAVKGDTVPSAVVLGNTLSWQWPSDASLEQRVVLGWLCDDLDLNLPGRYSEVR